MNKPTLTGRSGCTHFKIGLTVITLNDASYAYAKNHRRQADPIPTLQEHPAGYEILSPFVRANSCSLLRFLRVKIPICAPFLRSFAPFPSAYSAVYLSCQLSRSSPISRLKHASPLPPVNLLPRFQIPSSFVSFAPFGKIFRSALMKQNLPLDLFACALLVGCVANQADRAPSSPPQAQRTRSQLPTTTNSFGIYITAEPIRLASVSNDSRWCDPSIPHSFPRATLSRSISEAV